MKRRRVCVSIPVDVYAEFAELVRQMRYDSLSSAVSDAMRLFTLLVKEGRVADEERWRAALKAAVSRLLEEKC